MAENKKDEKEKVASASEAAETSNEASNPNHPNKAQLDAWRKQHKKLFMITVEGGHIVILKKPDMNAMASGLKKFKDDPMGFNRHIFNNCKLYCDPAILEDDDNMLAALSELGEVVKTKEATIKEI